MNALVRYIAGQPWGQAGLTYLRQLGVSGPLLLLLGSQVLTAGAGLAYGKIITLFVNPAAFGAYNLQSVTLMVLTTVFITPTIQSFMALSQQRGLSVIMPFYSWLTALLLGASLLVITGLWLAGWLEGWAFVAWGVGLGQCLFAYSTNLLLATGQLKRYSLLISLNPLLNLLLLLLVIFGLRQPTVAGLWLNALLLNMLLAVAATYLAARTEPAYRPAFGLPTAGWPALKPILTAYLAFVVPLLGYALCSSINNYADRYFINYFINPASVGFYAVAYSVGSRLGVVGNPFVNHLSPLMYQARKDEHHAGTTPLIYKHLRLLWLAGLPVCVVLYVFQEPIGLLLLSVDYRAAFPLFAVIGLAMVCMYSIQLFETKFYAYEKTQYILLEALAGAAANVLFNWLLLPAFGLMGAALATLLSFFVQLVVIAIFNKVVKFM